MKHVLFEGCTLYPYCSVNWNILSIFNPSQTIIVRYHENYFSEVDVTVTAPHMSIDRFQR